MTVAVMPALDAQTRIPAPSQLVVAWNSIFQTDKAKPPPAMAPKASSMAMSNQSRLDLCTESLGCETGSHNVMECQTVPEAEQPWEEAEPTQEEEEEEEETGDHGVLTAVRYHRAPRAFPPPLPSMSRRLQMRPVRRDGRFVVEAVAAKPQGYLHARRQEGRLRLCFVDCCSVSDQSQSQSQSQKQSISPMQQQSMVPQEEEDDDEVEVLDRGTMVEVVAASGGKASRIVINKFVGGAPMSSDSDVQQPSPPVAAAAPVMPGMRRVPSSTTTLAAAVAAAASSSSMDDSDDDDDEAEPECETSKEKKKLVFSWRAGAGAGDREELVQRVRRCRQLRRHKQPLFILEPYYTINIAT